MRSDFGAQGSSAQGSSAQGSSAQGSSAQGSSAQGFSAQGILHLTVMTVTSALTPPLMSLWYTPVWKKYERPL